MYMIAMINMAGEKDFVERFNTEGIPILTGNHPEYAGRFRLALALNHAAYLLNIWLGKEHKGVYIEYTRKRKKSA